MGKGDEVRQNLEAWESEHVCPACGHVVNLAELDMTAITTGIMTCPSCDWSGQIEIQVIGQVPRKKPTSTEYSHHADIGSGSCLCLFLSGILRMYARTNSLAIFDSSSARQTRHVLSLRLDSFKGRTVTPFLARHKAPAFTTKATLGKAMASSPGDMETAFMVYEIELFRRSKAKAREAEAMLDVLLGPNAPQSLLYFFADHLSAKGSS